MVQRLSPAPRMKLAALVQREISAAGARQFPHLCGTPVEERYYFSEVCTYGGLEAADLKRMRELEHENAKLKRMYANLALENLAMKDIIERNV